MRHLLTPSKICTPEYIYTHVFLAHANWTLVYFIIKGVWSIVLHMSVSPRYTVERNFFFEVKKCLGKKE